MTTPPKSAQPKGDAAGKAKAKKPALKKAPAAFAPPTEQSGSKKRPGRWKKGESGNPGGRPKEVAEVRDLARQHTVLAIETLLKWAKSDNARASVQACNVLLDRGWGKAPQSMEVTGKDGAPLVPVLNMNYGDGRSGQSVTAS
jgi:hypothetical protein